MILLVSPHNVVKKTLYVNDFKLDKTNMLENKQIEIYSEGINIALMLKMLQSEPFILTFIGGINGKHVKNYIHVNKIKSEMIHMNRSTYEKLNIVDTSTNNVTTIKDFYSELELKNMLFFLNAYKENLKKVSIAIFDDKINYYLSSDIIEKLYLEAAKLNTRIILDIKSKVNFDNIIKNKPHTIKMNKSSLMKNNIPIDSKEDLKIFAKDLISKGINSVLIDMHEEGIYYFNSKVIMRAESIIDIKSDNYRKSTDSALSAYASCIARGYEKEKALKMSLSAAMATILSDDENEISRKSVFDYRNKTKINVESI